jgi:hypothetical protein
MKSRDAMGLTPIMAWRPFAFRTIYDGFPLEETLFEFWRWVQDSNLLDETQHDPLNLGLSTSSTGWHCMAATLGFAYQPENFRFERDALNQMDSLSPFPYQMVSDLTQTTIRDRCVCWCNPPGQGCSALKSLWKTHADWRYRSYFRAAVREMFWTHSLLHHGTNNHNQETTEALISTLCTELVRLLTFEALDMTHTCCHLEEVENLRRGQTPSPAERKVRSAWDNEDRLEERHVIANCNPQLAEEIRSDSLEQQNARQLDEFMHEFEPQILNLDFSDPKSLETFIWGPWRRRISDLFTVVDDGIVAGMKEVLTNVTVTCKLESLTTTRKPINI